MATRFYLDCSNKYPAAYSPVAAAWDYFAVNALRSELLRSLPGSTPVSQWVCEITESDAAVVDVLAGQFVSAPLTAGQSFSTSQTVTGYWLTRMPSSTYDFGTQLVVKVVSFDGLTTQAVLYGPHTFGSTSTTAGNQDREFSSSGTHETRLLPGPSTPPNLSANYTTVAGDRLVIEVGARACNVTATARTADPRFVTDATNVSDHSAEGSGAVTSNTWIELSPTLTFDTSYTPSDGLPYLVERSAMVDAASLGTSVTPSTPTGTSTGDYVLVFAFDNTDDAVLTMSGDWDQLVNVKFNINGQCAVFGTVWSGSESLQVTTDSGSTGIMAFAATYRNVDPVTPMDATPVTSSSAAATTFTPTGITTVTDDAVVLSLVCTPDDNVLLLVGGSEQSFRNIAYGANYDTTVGADSSFGLSDKRVAAAGAVTAPTWRQYVNGNDLWGGITLALRPAASGIGDGSDASLDFGMAVGGSGTVTASYTLAGGSGLDFGMAVGGSDGSLIPGQVDVTGSSSLDFGMAVGGSGSLSPGGVEVSGGDGLYFGFATNNLGLVTATIDNTTTVYRLNPATAIRGKYDKQGLYRKVNRPALPKTLWIDDDDVVHEIRFPRSDLDFDNVFLGGSEYLLRDNDPRYTILVAAGYDMVEVG